MSFTRTAQDELGHECVQSKRAFAGEGSGLGQGL